MSSDSSTIEERKTYAVGDVVWFTRGEGGRPARGVVEKHRAGKPRVRLADDAEETVDPSRLVDAPAAPEVGETVWYSTANGAPASAVMQGEDENGWYRVTTGHGLTVPLNPGLVIDPPEGAGGMKAEPPSSFDSSPDAKPAFNRPVESVHAATAPASPSDPAASEPVKALTVCQPYSHLICLPESDPEHKRVENREWPTDYRGPLAIHAGKSREYLGAGDDGVPDEQRYPAMPFGAVEGVADLVHCFTAADIKAGKYDEAYPWLREHKHVEGPWCFVLANVRRLAEPVPTKGAQKFFNLPADVAAKVREQLAAPAAGAAPDVAPDPVALAQFETDGGTPGAVPPGATRTTESPKDERRAAALAEPPPPQHPVPSPDVWESILEARRRESSAAAHVESLKVELSEAKKVHEKASDFLGKLIDEAKYPTLFSGRSALQSIAADVKMPDSPAATATAAPAPPDDAWKADPTDVLKLKAGLQDKLAAADLTTTGAVEAWRSTDFERPKIKGIGEAAKQALADALENYHMARVGPAVAPALAADPAKGQPAAEDVEAVAADADAAEAGDSLSPPPEVEGEPAEDPEAAAV